MLHLFQFLFNWQIILELLGIRWNPQKKTYVNLCSRTLIPFLWPTGDVQGSKIALYYRLTVSAEQLFSHIDIFVNIPVFSNCLLLCFIVLWIPHI